MERDEVFVPKTRSRMGIKPAHETSGAEVEYKEEHQKQETTFEALDELLEDAPLWNLAMVIGQQVFGWPAYLIRNAAGQNYGRWTNHFDPSSPIFDKRHFWQIIMSDIGLIATIGALTIWGMQRGFREVALYYLIPYFIVHHHLVMITYLQHTDENLPHYRKGEWTFPKGALCTIDREFLGPLGNFFTHHITTTHVAHHVSSKIPHYHAHEATAALKEFLGDYYMYDGGQNIYASLWKNFRTCKFVEDTGSCVFYKNRFGKAKFEAVYEEDSGVAMSDGSASSGEEPDMDIEA